MNDEMANWLIDCYYDGTFTKDEAEKIVNASNMPISICFQINKMAKELFDDFIESMDHEKLDITEEACKIFLSDLEQAENLKKRLKDKQEKEQYHKLIE